MSDFANQIRDLREKTNKSRREFLRVEVQTCSIALDRAKFELSLGNSPEAKKEVAMVCRGIQVLERFLGEETEPLSEIEAKVAELKVAVEALRAALEGT